MTNILLLFVLIYILPGGQSYDDCVTTGADTLGPALQTRATTQNNDNIVSFLGVSNVVTCHGLISEWSIYYPGEITNSWACHNLHLQVWRPMGGERYMLVGQNYWDFVRQTDCDIVVSSCDLNVTARAQCGPNGIMQTVCTTIPFSCCWETGTSNPFNCFQRKNAANMPAEGIFKYRVPPGLRIPVQEGDVIGWVEDITTARDGERIYNYDEDLTGSNLYGTVRSFLTDTSNTAIGDIVDWTEIGMNGNAIHLVRDYSLQVTLTETKEPVIENVPTAPSRVTVKELQPPGEYLFTVRANNRHSALKTMPPPLTYTISGGSGIALFAIDSSTGELRTTQELDYEPENVYDLTITVLDGPTKSSSKTMYIFIEDVNEPHVLSGWPDRATIDCRTANTNNVVASGIYEDPDEDRIDWNTRWNTKTFYMVPDDPGLSVVRIATNNQFGIISVNKAVRDWVDKNVTRVAVYCSDGFYTAGPHYISIVFINMRQPPSLVNLPNTISIEETSMGNQDIFSVEGNFDTRSSAGEYNIIQNYPLAPKVDWMYCFQNGAPCVTERQTNNNVDVRELANPDYDYFMCNKYAVEIQVKDQVKYESKSQNLTVEIKWVNQAPTISPPTPPGKFIGTMPERQPIGTVIPGILLTGKDRDTQGDDWISYSISGNDAYLLKADNITHKIYVQEDIRVPDGLSATTLVFQVHVRDSKQLEDAADLEVTFTDINDQAPVFDPVEYFGIVNETDRGDSVVTSVSGGPLMVSATDNDGPPHNNDITYIVLDEEPAKYFEILKGGELIVKQPLNHSVNSNMTFTIAAIDNGYPSLNDTATVFIEIIDQDTHRPLFEQDFYNVEERSDIVKGSTVLKITANDLDLPSTSPVSYFLLKPDDTFRVQYSGDVQTEKQLSPGNKHLLYVYARDGEPNEKGTDYSDPCIVRIDTYDPKSHLMDIHLQFPLADFLPKQEEFIDKLNDAMPGWIIKPEKVILDGSPFRTLVTFYAIEDDITQIVEGIEQQKKFVHKKTLWKQMRQNIQGEPQDWLKSPIFREFQPVRVVPTYPDWLTETVPGIVVLTLMCLLTSALLGGATILLLKRNQLLCFKTKVTPSLPPQPKVEDEFALRYMKPNEDEPTIAFSPPAYSKK